MKKLRLPARLQTSRPDRKTSHPRIGRMGDSAAVRATRPKETPPDQPWFSRWFDSSYYPLLYQHRDEAEARFLLEGLLELLELPPDSDLLDLACGRGRHAVYLSTKGYQVTGIDLSADSIAHARTFSHDRLQFYVHDMRKPFGKKQYSCVLNLFTSFGYFGSGIENQNIINWITQALQPGGKLVIDFLNTGTISTNQESYQVKEVAGVQFELRKRVEANCLIKDIHLIDKGIHCSFQERVQLLTLPDFETYFRKAGLHLLHVLGDYNLTPYQEERSPRLILIAQKPIR